MAVRKIVTTDAKQPLRHQDSILRRECAAISEFGRELQDLVRDLVDTMEAHEIAVGLAAPQIGVSARVAVVDQSIVGSDEHLVLVNPSFIEESGKKSIKRESCMSLPPWGGDVEMRKKLHVRFLSSQGEARDERFDGFAARVVRHECDHLDGVLYPDRLAAGSKLVRLEIFEGYDG